MILKGNAIPDDILSSKSLNDLIVERVDFSDPLYVKSFEDCWDSDILHVYQDGGKIYEII